MVQKYFGKMVNSEQMLKCDKTETIEKQNIFDCLTIGTRKQGLNREENRKERRRKEEEKNAWLFNHRKKEKKTTTCFVLPIFYV